MRTAPITTDEIMGWKPCPDWPRERVAAYVGDGMSVDDFLACDLAARDLEWVLIRREVLDDDELAAVVRHCPAAKNLETDALSGGVTQSVSHFAGLNDGVDLPARGKVASLQIDLEALAHWPDPMGALSEAKRVSDTLTVDALKLYLADLRR